MIFLRRSRSFVIKEGFYRIELQKFLLIYAIIGRLGLLRCLYESFLISFGITWPILPVITYCIFIPGTVQNSPVVRTFKVIGVPR